MYNTLHKSSINNVTKSNTIDSEANTAIVGYVIFTTSTSIVTSRKKTKLWLKCWPQRAKVYLQRHAVTTWRVCAHIN